MGNQDPAGLFLLESCLPQVWSAAFPGQGQLCLSPVSLAFSLFFLRRQLSLFALPTQKACALALSPLPLLALESL